VELLPAASYAVIVMIFLPISNAMPETDHDVVPVAVPLVPFEAFDHDTCVTPTLSEEVPDSVTWDDLEDEEALLVGDVIVTTGEVVSVARAADFIAE